VGRPEAAGLTAVDKVHKGKGRTVNARFSVMCAHYLYDPDFCNVAAGWEKGRVEKNVQYSRRRIWIEAARHRFSSFVELNAWLGERCRALWNEIRHPEHSQFNVGTRWFRHRGGMPLFISKPGHGGLRLSGVSSFSVQ